MPLGLALTALALMLVALWLGRRWRHKESGFSDYWRNEQLPEHEKEERRARGLM